MPSLLGLGGRSRGNGGRGLDSFVARHFSTTKYRVNEYEVAVPFNKNADGTVRYGVYQFQYIDGARHHLSSIGEGVAVLNKWHDDGTFTKTGTWATTTDTTAIPGTNGGTARSSTVGDTIAASVTGHTLVLRYYSNVNGGFGFVAVDGDYTTANLLPAVAASDFFNVTAATDNGNGTWTFTCSGGHPFQTGSSIRLENVGGLTGANAIHLNITVANGTQFTVTAVITGTYTSGGTAGYFAQADLGKRYHSFYDNGSIRFDMHQGIAEGLSDAAHTVTVQVVGTAYDGGAAGNQRVYVTGFAAARSTYEPDDGANYSIGVIRWLSSMWTNAAMSNMVVAPEFNPTGQSNYQFISGVHDNETQTSVTVLIDGVETALSAGDRDRGQRIELLVVGTLVHPSTGATKQADITYNYVASSQQRYSLRCHGNVTWAAAGTVRAGYYGMLFSGLAKMYSSANPIFDTIFNRVTIGSTAVTDLSANAGANLGSQSPAPGSGYFWSTLHNTRMGLFIPDKSQNSNNYNGTMFCEDRPDGGEKIYFSRSDSGSPEGMGNGQVCRFDNYYHVWRA